MILAFYRRDDQFQVELSSYYLRSIRFYVDHFLILCLVLSVSKILFEKSIETTMLFIVLSLLTVQSIQAENLFNTAVNGQGFVVDPFLELTGGVTVPPDSKSSRPEPACFNNGTLTITVFCTLLLSALVGFLIWLIYLREKLQGLSIPIDLRSYLFQ